MLTDWCVHIAAIKNDILKIEENPWQPDFEVECGKEKFESTLEQLLSFGDKRISLSLSGGLDSRLLLSYLLNKNSELWETHTFGRSESSGFKNRI